MKKSNLKWWVLLTVIVGTFLGRLDQTIVNLALPHIMDDFSINLSQAGWIATAYILANAVFVPIWGKLGDTIGRKKVYIFGFSIFILGSILAGFSWNLSSMILFRIIQAIAASADYPTAMAIIAVTFNEGRERAQALGIWSASFAAASVFGPLMGGPLIDYFGWRSVFIINLPIGLIGILMAVLFIDESVSGKFTRNFDWWGAVTLGISLSALVLVLDKGLDWGWGSWQSLLCYAIFAASLWVFYLIDKSHPEPLVDLRFFRSPNFVSGCVNNFIVFMGLMGAVFVIPVFVQIYLGYTATETGYLFIPMAFSLVAAAAIGGRLAGRFKGEHVVTVSTFGAAVGLFFLSRVDARSSALDVMLPLSFMAFFLGLGMAQRTIAITSSVPKNEVGAASSVLALVRNISGAFGIAVFATILRQTTEAKVMAIAQNSAVHAADLLTYSQGASLIILKAQIFGYKTVFLMGGFLLLIGTIVGLFLKVGNADTNGNHVEEF
jgi:EmrB/QacA subfamily drug resistance transporter